MEVSEPESVNPNDIQYGVNLFKLGGLHLLYNIILHCIGKNDTKF